MPGIICTINKNNQPDYQFNQQIELASDYFSKPETECFIENGFHIAVIKPQWLSSQKCLLVNDDYIFAFYGSVYDSNYTKQLDNYTQLIDVLFSRYKQQGIKALKGLNGNYVIAHWHKKTRIFEFISDRFGIQRHYWSKKTDSFYLSCELKTIACTSQTEPTINQTALGSMLTFGYHIGNLTLFNDIWRTPNACHLTYDANKCLASVQQYWDYAYTGDNSTTKTENQLAEEMYQALFQATKIRCEQSEKILLPLSGGLDSRTVAGLLKRCQFNGDIHSFSYGAKSSRDLRYAKKIAHVLGYPFQGLKTPANYITDFLEQATWQFDSEWSGELYYARYSHLHPTFSELHKHSVLSGLHGDIFCGSDLFNYRNKVTKQPLSSSLLSDYYINIHAEYGCNLSLFFPTKIAKSVADELRSILQDSCKNLTRLAPFYALLRMEFIHRQHRQTARVSQSIEYDNAVITPFLDNDFVDLMISIPDQYFYGKRLYKTMINNHLPELAKIPNSDTGLPISSAPLREALSWRLQKLLNSAPQLKKLLHSNIGNFKFSNTVVQSKAYFLTQQPVLNTLCPPCEQTKLSSHYLYLLADKQISRDQILAILPPAFYTKKILNKRQLIKQGITLKKEN